MLEKIPTTIGEKTPDVSPYTTMTKLELIDERRILERKKVELENMIASLLQDMSVEEKNGDFTKVLALQKVGGVTRKELDALNRSLTEIEHILDTLPEPETRGAEPVENVWNDIQRGGTNRGAQ